MSTMAKPGYPVSTSVASLGVAPAPFVYFDGAVAFGTGIDSNSVLIELAATVLTPSQDGVPRRDTVMTAHLRCSPTAARNLRDAIDRVLEMQERNAASHSVRALN